MSTRYAPTTVLERARSLAAGGRADPRLIPAIAALKEAVESGDKFTASQRVHLLVTVAGDVAGQDTARWVAAGDGDSHEGEAA